MATIEWMYRDNVGSVPGFQTAGVAAGLKPEGALDLALVYSEKPCVAAGVFTTNAFKAAPVLLDQEIVRGGKAIQGVVINSGCANACTGVEGMQDAREMAGRVAQAVDDPEAGILVMSTGVIGARLPMALVREGIEKATGALRPGRDAGMDAARAIMTTDTRPKTVAVRVVDGDSEYWVAGMAKGAGMIHPNMATMLGLIVTDANVSRACADSAIRTSADESFNAISVDGDMSTNDTLLLLANGASGADEIDDPEDARYATFREAVGRVAQHLARAVVYDGEGATRFIEICVRGARQVVDAKRVAKSVANSLLVKTAIYGQDANWGRIVCAVGYSGVSLDPDRVSVWLGDVHLVRNGAPYDTDETRASAVLAQREIPITIDLGLGEAQATVWTTDISHRYVDINAHYRT